MWTINAGMIDYLDFSGTVLPNPNLPGKKARDIDMKIIKRELGKVERSHGTPYANIVKRCLWGNFKGRGDLELR